MENSEKSILFPQAQINLAILLCTFIDFPFQSKSIKAKISFDKAVDMIEQHDEKFKRDYDDIIKKYILSGLLDFGYISIRKIEQKEDKINFQKMIDNLQIQFHRQKTIMNKIPYDCISLYEQLDKDRKGYISIDSIFNYIKVFDPQGKILKRQQRQKFYLQIKQKLCNNIHNYDEELVQNKNIKLENFMELFERIIGQKSFTYKMLDELMRQRNRKQYNQLICKSYGKLRNNINVHDQNNFQKQFYNSKVNAYKMVQNDKDCNSTNNYDDEYRTIKRQPIIMKQQNQIYTPRNILLSNSKQTSILGEINKKYKTKSQIICQQVQRIILERVKNRIKYYNVIGL